MNSHVDESDKASLNHPQQNGPQQNKAWRFFWVLTSTPRTIIIFSICLAIGLMSFLPTLQKDTRSDAFMPVDHPALLLTQKAKETFGLGDPFIIALINKGPEGVFNPHTLKLVDWLTQELENIDNIDPEGITSLATENNIIGSEDGMEVEPFFEELPETLEEAQKIKAKALAFPLYVGSMVAADGSGTVIIVEQLNTDHAQGTYEALLALVKSAPTNADESIHIAGEGALTGYFGAYIDADAARVMPLSVLIILALCYVAFATLRGTLLPAFIVLVTAASALGFMAAVGVSFFVITNALPVVLIGIAVADSIHILTEYYEVSAQYPDLNSRELTCSTMSRIWRPITLTSLTTIAGFFGLAMSSIMPPMKYFGLFALFGVCIAWAYSLFVLPAMLTLMKVKPGRAFRTSDKTATMQASSEADSFGKIMSVLGNFTLAYPKSLLSVGLVIVLLGIHGGSKIELDESLIRAFQPDEPIVIASDVINATFNGTSFLDVIIETPENEDLFKPENLQKIEALQAHIEQNPYVTSSTSIVDYLKQMNRAMHADVPEAYQLPKTADLSAQYMLLYSVTADPTDFDNIIDYDYRLANVRITLAAENYITLAKVVEDLYVYIETFNNETITARPAGRAVINYEWMQRIADGHVKGVCITLALVFIMAAISFRSLQAGLFCLVPIATTIFAIYAFMGYNDIALSVSSSMFAAISIGLGVDFSIHTTERLQTLIAQTDKPTDQTLLALFPSTGRALLFNFLTLASGFGILIISKVVILQEFGICVALSITISFLASLMLLPAIAKTFKPQFLGYTKANDDLNTDNTPLSTPSA